MTMRGRIGGFCVGGSPMCGAVLTVAPERQHPRATVPTETSTCHPPAEPNLSGVSDLVAMASGDPRGAGVNVTPTPDKKNTWNQDWRYAARILVWGVSGGGAHLITRSCDLAPCTLGSCTEQIHKGTHAAKQL